ncbi:hypothetical protein D3C80_754580 [compost metagenome]
MRHSHALLHVGVIAVQLLELQGLEAQQGHQLAKTLVAGVQVAITEVELLALGVVDAQVERVARLAALAHGLGMIAEVLEGTQLAETGQAAYQRQDARMEGAHHFPSLHRAQRVAPQAQHIDQLGDEILARFAGEGHHGHGIELEPQVMGQQEDAQYQRGRLAGAGTGNHIGRRRFAEDHLPLRRARLGMAGQALGNIGLDAFLQLGGDWQTPVVEQVVVDPGHGMGLRPGITDQQHLPTFLDTIDAAFVIPLAQAIGMAGALADHMPLEPGIAVLGPQATQATPQHPRHQALEQGQLGGGRQFGRQLGHADSRGGDDRRPCSLHSPAGASQLPIDQMIR